MNKHIELVKRYLAGEDVTTKELRANSIAADAAVHAASAAAQATYATWANARTIARGNRGDKKAAAHWVKQYEELTGDR